MDTMKQMTRFTIVAETLLSLAIFSPSANTALVTQHDSEVGIVDDPPAKVWTDQAGGDQNFTATYSARPALFTDATPSGRDTFRRDTLRFDGASNKMTFGATSAFDSAPSLTFMMALKPTTTTTSDYFLQSEVSNAPNGFGWGLYHDDSGNFVAQARSATGAFNATIADSALGGLKDDWMILTGVYTDTGTEGTIQLFLTDADGVLHTSSAVTVTGGLANGTHVLTSIGADIRAKHAGAADIAAVYIWNEALDSTARVGAETSLYDTYISPEPRKRKVFAHYMGNYPVAAASTEWHRRNAHDVRHDGEGNMDPYGSRWRNWPLVPDGTRLTLEESADLEIRRAMRAGIDGFAVDAWAGGDGAEEVFDALVTVAERNDYPFELTICYDPHCQQPKRGHPGKHFEDCLLSFLERYGDHPKLARRDGKVLIFGYHSIWPAVFGIELAEFLANPSEVEYNSLWRSADFRLTSEGWRRYREAFDRIEEQFGQEIYWQFDMEAFFFGRHMWRNRPSGYDKDTALVEAAKVMADMFPAVQGAFLGDASGGSPLHDRMAAAIRAKGAEWSQPMLFQYENLMYKNCIGNGADILRRAWKDARKNDSTLIQFVTWNDYTENTMLAPGYETRYAILDLNRHFIDWWKTGREPTSDHDKIYLIYRKYIEGSKLYPFQAKHGDPSAGHVIEVLTILPEPARLRLVGRDAEWDAPAGMSHRQFPMTPGPVIAELLRDGKLVARLESPEPITDRPFREQGGMTAVSTEFKRHWRADFGEDVPPLLRGEYADDDDDGLPNWFEMYWFGKFLDWSTATAADPNVDVDGDGRTNIEEYLDRTDPTTLDGK